MRGGLPQTWEVSEGCQRKQHLSRELRKRIQMSQPEAGVCVCVCVRMHTHTHTHVAVYNLQVLV